MSRKLSRAEQFNDMFMEFVSKHLVNTGKICKWEFNLLTENTRKNIHDYRLVIPAKYLAFYTENEFTMEDGTTQGPGIVYLPQEIPPMDDFIQEVHSYFGKYGDTFRSLNAIPGVKIGVLVIQDNGNHTIDIRVIYGDKCRPPYPVPLTREQELEKQLMEATNQIVSLEEKIRAYKCEKIAYSATVKEQCKTIQNQSERLVKWQRAYKAMEIKAARFTKLERTFKKMATDSYKKGAPQDCPICFEPIAVETLHTTLCGHNLCTSCNSKCTRCPLCRENY
jgi:hypothetical protein